MGALFSTIRFAPSRVLGWAFAANTGYVLWLIVFHLNFLQIDMAGHMAGAMSLLRVGLHGYQDQFFQGYIQNLFYPPMEDLILAGMYVASGYRHVLAFKLYLVSVTAAFCFSIWYLSRMFRSEAARSIVLLLCILLLNIKKANLTNYQGLSFCDLLIAGLTSQVLAGALFFFLIREVFGKKRVDAVGGILAGIFLTHIVISFVALFVVGLFLIQERRLRNWIRIGLWCLTTAFFLVPFVITQAYLVSSRLTIFEPWRLFLFALIGLLLFWKDPRIRLLLTVACALLMSILLAVGPDVHTQSLTRLGTWFFGRTVFELPAFHYYRFAMPALFLVIVAAGFQIDRWQELPRGKGRMLLVLYLLAGLLVVRSEIGSRIQSYDTTGGATVEGGLEKIGDNLNWSKDEGIPRTWVIGNSRAIDFGLESYLSLSQPQIFFNKGLLWESSRNTLLTSSYLATLFGPPTVLDYFYFFGYDCKARACLIDLMSRDQGLQSLVFSTESPPQYLDEQERACMQEILTQGTAEVTFAPVGSLQVNNTRLQTFHLQPRTPQDGERRHFVEIIDPTDIKFYADERKRFYFAPLLEEYFGACIHKELSPHTIFIRAEGKADLEKFMSGGKERLTSTQAVARGVRISSGNYRINVTGTDGPSLFRIKLNYFPGLRLRSASGEELPIFEGLSGLVGFGAGELTLVYERPLSFYLAYMLSVLALGALAWHWYRARLMRQTLKGSGMFSALNARESV